MAMAGRVDLSQVDKIIKQTYPEDGVTKAILFQNVLFELMTKGRGTSMNDRYDGQLKKIVLFSQFATQGGFGMADASGNLPYANSDAVDQNFQFGVPAYHSVLELSERLLHDSSLDVAVNVAKRQMDDAILNNSTFFNVALNGKGDGLLAAVTGAQGTILESGTTWKYTIPVDETSFVPMGQLFDIYSAAGVRLAAGAKLIGSDVRFGAGTVSVQCRAQLTGVVSGDKFYIQNAKGQADLLMGLDSIVSDTELWPATATAPLDRTDDANIMYRSQVIDAATAGAADTLTLFDRVMTALRIVGGRLAPAEIAGDKAAAARKELSFAVMDPFVHLQLDIEARQYRRYNEYTIDDVGVKTSTINGVPILDEPLMKKEAKLLQLDDFRYFLDNFYWMPGTDGIWLRKSGTTTMEAVGRILIQIHCVSPWRQGKISNIATPQALRPGE